MGFAAMDDNHLGRPARALPFVEIAINFNVMHYIVIRV